MASFDRSVGFASDVCNFMFVKEHGATKSYYCALSVITKTIQFFGVSFENKQNSCHRHLVGYYRNLTWKRKGVVILLKPIHY